MIILLINVLQTILLPEMYIQCLPSENYKLLQIYLFPFSASNDILPKSVIVGQVSALLLPKMIMFEANCCESPADDTAVTSCPGKKPRQQICPMSHFTGSGL